MPRGLKMRIRLEWKVQDLWIGAYWKTACNKTDIWVCLLPCIPIHVTLLQVEREAT